MPTTPQLLTLAQAADYLGCSESLVRKLVATAGLPCDRLGVKYVFHADELDAWRVARRESRQEPRKASRNAWRVSDDGAADVAKALARCGL